MTGPIQHTVAFNLRHQPRSAEEDAFLQAALVLATIPGVENYQQLRQVSPKSGYRLFFSMVFADEAAYQAYNDHPDHVGFVRDRWASDVTEFQEMDFVALR